MKLSIAEFNLLNKYATVTGVFRAPFWEFEHNDDLIMDWTAELYISECGPKIRKLINKLERSYSEAAKIEIGFKKKKRRLSVFLAGDRLVARDVFLPQEPEECIY